MEIIRNYLEAMFAQMPDTAQVRRAKDELWQMMEDQYNELIGEGRTENEAVGTVISEFGNLEELAESLGIPQVVHSGKDAAYEQKPDRMVLDQIDLMEFISANIKRALLLSLGIFFCIASVMFPILDVRHDGSMGAGIMFVCVAAGVFLIVFSSSMVRRWKELFQGGFLPDGETIEFMKEQKQQFGTMLTIFMAVGIMLCVLSIVPPILFSGSNLKIPGIGENLGPALMFLIVGLGVMLIVCSATISGGFSRLLEMNDGEKRERNARKRDARFRSNTTLGLVLSVYWQIVICFYLGLSFLTFRWGTTWIIWPLAGVVRKILTALYEREEPGMEGKE